MNGGNSFFGKIWRPGNIAFWLLLVLLLSSFPLTQGYQTQTESIDVTYNFECPTFETINIDGSSYDRVFLADCVTASNSGEPNIPSKGAYILLPPKSKASNIRIVAGEKHLLGTDFNVDPIGEPIPIIQSPVVKKLSKNNLIYQSNLLYPGNLYTEVGTYSFRGYEILVLLLHPVQYNPVNG